MLPAGVDAVAVLHADHRRDGLGLGEVLGADVGEAQVADQAGVAQVGERAEVLGDRAAAQPVRAQVHHVEVVAAELAQVLLDLRRAAAPGGRRGQPPPDGSRPGPTLVTMTRSSGYGASAAVISSVAERGRADAQGAAGREVERGGVDVVDAELDRAAQHGRRPGPGRGSAVIRMEPKPIRCTVRSPSVQVPAAAAVISSVGIGRP